MKLPKFQYDSREHHDWLATNRTHEECHECRFLFEQNPPCWPKGHAAGPTACRHYRKTNAAMNAAMGDYDNPENGCPSCGRHRVMRGADDKHRCEKCAWCIEDNAIDLEFLDYLN